MTLWKFCKIFSSTHPCLVSCDMENVYERFENSAELVSWMMYNRKYIKYIIRIVVMLSDSVAVIDIKEPTRCG